MATLGNGERSGRERQGVIGVPRDLGRYHASRNSPRGGSKWQAPAAADFSFDRP